MTCGWMLIALFKYSIASTKNKKECIGLCASLVCVHFFGLPWSFLGRGIVSIVVVVVVVFPLSPATL